MIKKHGTNHGKTEMPNKVKAVKELAAIEPPKQGETKVRDM